MHKMINFNLKLYIVSISSMRALNLKQYPQRLNFPVFAQETQESNIGIK